MKKILAIIMSCFLCMTISACSQQKNTDNAASSPAPTPAAVQNIQGSKAMSSMNEGGTADFQHQISAEDTSSQQTPDAETSTARQIEIAKTDLPQVNTQTSDSIETAQEHSGENIEINNNKVTRTEGVDSSIATAWPSGGLANMVPKPSFGKIIIAFNESDSFSAQIENVSRDNLNSYVDILVSKGFKMSNESVNNGICAYDFTSNSGYELSLFLADGVLMISLAKPDPEDHDEPEPDAPNDRQDDWCDVEGEGR